MNNLNTSYATRFALVVLGFSVFLSSAAFARCDYPDDLDSAGRRCGGRAASVIPGGRLGGDGNYQDSQGRNRLYGTNNDPYDKQPSSYSGYSSNTFNDDNESEEE